VAYWAEASSFALVEERSGFLAFQGVVAELDAVHGEGGGGLFTLQQAGSASRKSFEFANARIDALNDRTGRKTAGQFGEDGQAHGIDVHGLGEDLQRKNVVVSVDDKAGRKSASLKTTR